MVRTIAAGLDPAERNPGSLKPARGVGQDLLQVRQEPDRPARANAIRTISTAVAVFPNPVGATSTGARAPVR